ncbi:MAG: glycosyltransferase, partial [Clostridia bacterium]|nr:glycosyltransferase [Clostridia bacterium]
VSIAKRLTLIPAFKYEISRYRKSVSRLFLPTMIMQKYGLDGMEGFPLPPGGDIYPELLEKKANRIPVEDGKLKLFYVGSLSSMYDNTKLFEAVKNTENVYLTVCTHKNQWESLKETYAPYMCDRIEIVHKSGKDLIPHYLEADISPYCLNKCDYLDLAMPIKVFETISYGTPLLVADIHSIGELVKNENIGWNTKNTAEGIADTLKFLRDNPNEIAEKTANTISIVSNHTWLARAKQAAEQLTK